MPSLVILFIVLTDWLVSVSHAGFYSACKVCCGTEGQRRRCHQQQVLTVNRFWSSEIAVACLTLSPSQAWHLPDRHQKSHCSRATAFFVSWRRVPGLAGLACSKVLWICHFAFSSNTLSVLSLCNLRPKNWLFCCMASAGYPFIQFRNSVKKEPSKSKYSWRSRSFPVR